MTSTCDIKIVEIPPGFAGSFVEAMAPFTKMKKSERLRLVNAGEPFTVPIEDESTADAFHKLCTTYGVQIESSRTLLEEDDWSSDDAAIKAAETTTATVTAEEPPPADDLDWLDGAGSATASETAENAENSEPAPAQETPTATVTMERAIRDIEVEPACPECGGADEHQDNCPVVAAAVARLEASMVTVDPAALAPAAEPVKKTRKPRTKKGEAEAAQPEKHPAEVWLDQMQSELAPLESRAAADAHIAESIGQISDVGMLTAIYDRAKPYHYRIEAMVEKRLSEIYDANLRDGLRAIADTGLAATAKAWLDGVEARLRAEDEHTRYRLALEIVEAAADAELLSAVRAQGVSIQELGDALDVRIRALLQAELVKGDAPPEVEIIADRQEHSFERELTDDDWRELGKTSAQAARRAADLKAELDRTSKRLKGAIEVAVGEAVDAQNAMLVGKRTITVEVRAELRTDGMVHSVRLDTGEVVERRPLTEQERQRSLFASKPKTDGVETPESNDDGWADEA